jgi:hypothetical protein
MQIPDTECAARLMQIQHQLLLPITSYCYEGVPPDRRFAGGGGWCLCKSSEKLAQMVEFTAEFFFKLFLLHPAPVSKSIIGNW